LILSIIADEFPVDLLCDKPAIQGSHNRQFVLVPYFSINTQL